MKKGILSYVLIGFLSWMLIAGIRFINNMIVDKIDLFMNNFSLSSVQKVIAILFVISLLFLTFWLTGYVIIKLSNLLEK